LGRGPLDLTAGFQPREKLVAFLIRYLLGF
jgi:hypothetical protein